MDPISSSSAQLVPPHCSEHRVSIGALSLRQQFGTDFCTVTVAQIPAGLSLTFTLALSDLALLVELVRTRIGSAPRGCPSFLYSPTGEEWRIISRDLTVRVPHSLLAEMRGAPPELYDPASAAAPSETSAA